MTSLEGRLISSCLNDKQIHPLLQGNVDEILRTHGDIWNFIKVHYDSFQSIPPPERVVEKFPDFVYDPDASGTKYHLEELKADFLDNGVRNVLRNASLKVKDQKPMDAIDYMVQEAVDLKRLTSNVRDIDVGNVDDAVAYYEEVAEQQASGIFGVKTGLPMFDYCLPSGIMPGHFGVILAYPARGKSWFLAYLAVQAWRNGKTPLIVSLEMTEEEVRNRVFTIIANGYFSHRKLSAGRIDIEDFKRWHKQTFEGKPPIHIISSIGSTSVTPSLIQGKIHQYRPDAVFLDYLNLMESNQKADSETVKMKQLSQQCKMLAVSEKVPLIAISSATPDSATDMQSAPTMGQVSWSRQVSYDADWMVAIGREDNSPVMEIVFRKNRHGELGEFALVAEFDKGMFGYKGL